MVDRSNRGVTHGVIRYILTIVQDIRSRLIFNDLMVEI